MAKVEVQIVRRAEGAWELTRLQKVSASETAWSYELIGRVEKRGNGYVALLPRWTMDGHDWIEQPRKFLLDTTAFKWIIDWKEPYKQ